MRPVAASRSATRVAWHCCASRWMRRHCAWPIPRAPGPVIALDHEGERVSAQVWGTHCDAFDAGHEVSGFLSEWLGRPLRMVRFDPAGRRLSNQDWTAGREVPNFFSDGYPLLVLSRASIADLAARVGRDLPVQPLSPQCAARWRGAVCRGHMPPGCRPGAVTLALTKACIRCVITTIDQATGTSQDEEPIATLKRYRFDTGAARRGLRPQCLCAGRSGAKAYRAARPCH